MTESRELYYETKFDWESEKEGELKGPGLPSLTVGAPSEFKGRGGQWTPEHLFVAAVNSCFTLTLLAIAENSQLPLISFSSAAKGKLEKVGDAGYQITEIVIKPTIVIASAHDLARTARILERAKENCLVTNSIKAPVTLQPEIFHRQTATSPCPL